MGPRRRASVPVTLLLLLARAPTVQPITCVFSGASVRDQKGTSRYCADLTDKVVALYFCRESAAACKQFGPVLRHFHALHRDAVQLVFVSTDGSADAAEAYFRAEHGDWYALDWSDGLSRELRVTTASLPPPHTVPTRSPPRRASTACGGRPRKTRACRS